MKKNLPSPIHPVKSIEGKDIGDVVKIIVQSTGHLAYLRVYLRIALIVTIVFMIIFGTYVFLT